jgi:hypothetical protein
VHCTDHDFGVEFNAYKNYYPNVLSSNPPLLDFVEYHECFKFLLSYILNHSCRNLPNALK